MRRIAITYEVVTPESAAEGDYAEAGWEDETGLEVEPDQYDLDEHDGNELAAVVALAVKIITDQGGVEPSDLPRCCPGHTWYTTSDPDRDYSTGSETRYSYHLRDFLPE